MSVLTCVSDSGSLDGLMPFISDFIGTYNIDFDEIGMDVIFASAFLMWLILVVFFSLRKL